MSTMRLLPHNLPARSLIDRLFPRRELLLKRSWIIGGYGRPLPRRASVDAAPAPRPLQLRRDQIIAPAPQVLELREEQIIARGPQIGSRRLVRIAPTAPANSAAAMRA